MASVAVVEGVVDAGVGGRAAAAVAVAAARMDATVAVRSANKMVKVASSHRNVLRRMNLERISTYLDVLYARESGRALGAKRAKSFSMISIGFGPNMNTLLRKYKYSQNACFGVLDGNC